MEGGEGSVWCVSAKHGRGGGGGGRVRLTSRVGLFVKLVRS